MTMGATANDVVPGTTWGYHRQTPGGTRAFKVNVKSLGDVCTGGQCDHADGHLRVNTNRGNYCAQLISWCWHRIEPTPPGSPGSTTGGRL